MRTQAVLKSTLPVLMVQQQPQYLLAGNGSPQSMNASGQGNGLSLVDQGQNGSGGGGNSGGGINTILRVVVENAMYPVSLDVLHGVSSSPSILLHLTIILACLFFFQIFGRFGKVLKIIIFTKNRKYCLALITYFCPGPSDYSVFADQFQVLIQYLDRQSASAAKQVSMLM